MNKNSVFLAVVAAALVQLAKADTPVQGTLTIQGYTDSANVFQWPTLTLEKDSSGAPYVSLGYTENGTTGVFVQSIGKATAEWQWQALDSTSVGRLQMKLDTNNILSLVDPSSTSGSPTFPIVINPNGSSAQILINGQPVATAANGSLGFGLVGNGGIVVGGNGNVGIGTATPAQQLTITGNMLLSASSSTGGVIYQYDVNGNVAPILNTYSWGNGLNYDLYNIFVGRNSGNTTLDQNACDNVGVGTATLKSLTTGFYNTAVGGHAGQEFTTGEFNTAIGEQALSSATDNLYEVAIGHAALMRANHTSQNTAVGDSTLFSLVTGGSNTAVGHHALFNANFINAWDGSTTAIGAGAGFSTTTGSYNTFLGTLAALNNTTGTQNIVIGYYAELPDPTASNCLNIGNLIYGTGVDGQQTNISSGNIGIGIAAPQAKLHVNGDVRFDGAVKMTQAQGDILMGDFGN